MVWERVKESLKAALAENIFDLWIEPLTFVEMRGEHLYLASPDRFFSAYVKQNFLAVIEEKIRENGLESVKIIFCEERCQSIPAPRAERKAGAKIQMRLPNVPVNNSRFRSLHPRYTFDEFMVGESNILAESACRSMVVKDDTVGPCLYINSATGLGKSHLTHAVAHQIFAHSPMTRLHYVTAKQFAAEMVRGIKNNAMESFKAKYLEHCDILLVEDNSINRQVAEEVCRGSGGGLQGGVEAGDSSGYRQKGGHHRGWSQWPIPRLLSEVKGTWHNCI